MYNHSTKAYTFLGLFLFIFTILLTSCESDNSNTTRPKIDNIQYNLVNSSTSGITFTNKIEENKTRNQLQFDYFYNGAGIALADFNNDGLTDIFFCGNDAPNAIYKNTGKLTFQDVTPTAISEVVKWSNGATIVDINNDGLKDIYVSNGGPDVDPNKLKNQLWVNNGDFSFTDQAKLYGLDIDNYGVQADFFDFDNDGDLDLWLNAHGKRNTIQQLSEKNDFLNTANGNLLSNLNKLKTPEITRGSLQLFENKNGKFIDVSKKSGIQSLAFGLGLSIADFNDDGFLDVYVANDYWIPDFYYINTGKGTFEEKKNLLNHTSYFSMGSDVEDFNNDGLLDLMVVDMTPSDHYRNKTLMSSMKVSDFYIYTNMYKFNRQYMFNALQLGVGNGSFSEISNAINVGSTGWSWAPLIFDMNNDGLKDFYITNGYFRDTKNQDYRTALAQKRKEKGAAYTDEMAFEELKKVASTPIHNIIYQNNGSFKFNDLSTSSSDLGPSFSNGAAYGDLDNDGDLDLVLNNLNQVASILENKGGNNYLSIILEAPSEVQTKFSSVTIYYENQKIRRDYTFTKGYLSSMQQRLLFGINKATKVDRIEIDWFDGNQSILTNIEANQILKIDYSKTQMQKKKRLNKKPFFYESSALQQAGINYPDSVFNDFKHEVLLPQKYSTLGPALASGDINKDGLDDFFIGGSKGYPGKIVLMTSRGFETLMIPDLEKDALYEDIGAELFDANNDGLLDLYVASGGGKDANQFQDRLYINRGNKQFSKANNALPKIKESTQTILPFDMDKDGDLDLFVGGRNAPGMYPSKSESYLLENKNGSFTNIIQPSFQNNLPNMVTDAELLDFNEDGYLDLFVVGEWSSPILFINTKKKDFSVSGQSNLENLTGWWYSITKGDFNNDQKPDFILGNLGLNNKFKASKEKPLKVYYNDFDGNGSQDIFLAKKYKNNYVPVRGKECSSEQMPMLNEKFKSYDQFASASIEDVLTKEKMDKGQSHTVKGFESLILINNGESFDIEMLPFEAQIGPILDSEVFDFNKDGNQDILIAGNIFDTEPETPSYDANKGLLLVGNGDGSFSLDLDIKNTGLHLNRNTKQIELVMRPGAIGVIGANNNGYAQLFVKQ